MNKIIMSLVVGVFLLTGTTVFAEKGASETAQEHASDEAIFNRTGDWFATIGKSKEEKKKILAERKMKRMEEKAARKAEKAMGKADKESGKIRKNMNKEKDKGSKKGL